MKFITLICFLAIFSIHFGQESFTLEKAQNYALANNKEIFNAKLDQKIMEAKIWETTAQGLPQVNAEGTFQNFIDIPTQVLPANAFNPMAPAGEWPSAFWAGALVVGDVVLCPPVPGHRHATDWRRF